MASAFEQAWTLLKLDFRFDKDVENRGYVETDEDEYSDPEGIVNLGSDFHEVHMPSGYKPGGKYGEWRDYDAHKWDQALMQSILNTARHEGIHESLMSLPEWQEATKHAIMEHEFHDNPIPALELMVANEAMANFQDRANTPSHLRENVREYPWRSSVYGSGRELWNESQKVKQGEWRGDDGAL